jgi:hypothetical protein
VTDPAKPSHAEISTMQQIKLRQNKIDREKIELETLNRQRIPATEVRDLLARLRLSAKRELGGLVQIADRDPSLTAEQRTALRAALTEFITTYCAAMAKVDL